MYIYVKHRYKTCVLTNFLLAKILFCAYIKKFVKNVRKTSKHAMFMLRVTEMLQMLYIYITYP